MLISASVFVAVGEPPKTTTTTTIITTLTTTTNTMVTIVTTTSTTTTQTGPKYLTASQGAAEGGQYFLYACPSGCNSTNDNGLITSPIVGMTVFYSQVDVNASSGMSAIVSSNLGDRIAVYFAGPTPYTACFEILLQMDGKSVQIGTAVPPGLQLPPTIYVWYVGQSCPSNPP